jgi:hypothetical protein
MAGVGGADPGVDAIGWGFASIEEAPLKDDNFLDSSVTSIPSALLFIFSFLTTFCSSILYSFSIYRYGLGEDDGLVGVGEDAVGEVPADGSGEDEAFEVSALLDEVG